MSYVIRVVRMLPTFPEAQCDIKIFAPLLCFEPLHRLNFIVMMNKILVHKCRP